MIVSRSVRNVNYDAALSASLRPRGNFPKNFSKFDQSLFMKTKQELKEELHKLIDSIEDEVLLQDLTDNILPEIIAYRQTDDGDEYLTEEQLKQLDEAIAEADRGETMSYEEFLESMSRWRTDFKQKHLQ